MWDALTLARAQVGMCSCGDGRLRPSSQAQRGACLL